jgi:hypothetical protein
VDGKARPLFIHSDRGKEAQASASA